MGSQKIDPILWLLFLGMAFFSGMLIYVEHVFPTDGQLFMVVSGMLTSFSGAFFMRVKPQAPPAAGDSIEHPVKAITETKTTVTAPGVPAEKVAATTTVEAVAPEKQTEGNK